MNFDTTITRLRMLIEKALCPLVDADYMFLDLPFYQNPGDTLIWEGTEQFLEKLPHKCIYRSSYDTFVPQDISSDVVILMQGGGNFDDIWREHQKFRLSIIRRYQKNRIIILPQSVHYDDVDNLREDARIMGEHPELIICARDRRSYRILEENRFSKNILLLPDMAFCIHDAFISQYRSKMIFGKSLFVKRGDKEFMKSGVYEKRLGKILDLVIQDWPSYENPDDRIISEFWRIKDNESRTEYIRYAEHVLRPYLLELGIGFVSSYDKIYTTRLHVAILCVLLHKPVCMFDNSYGKNREFYETWLVNVRSVRFIYDSGFDRIKALWKYFCCTVLKIKN